MPQLPDLRIIIPACNESSRIEPTIRDYCELFSHTATILVVANGCTDETAHLVRTLQRRYENLQLIEIAGRIGKGGAVRSGLWTGAEPFVGFVDADGSTSAIEFSRLFNLLREGAAGGIIGSRWLPGSRVEPRQPFMRRLASRCFNGIVRTLFALPFADTQCGAKIFQREAITYIAHSLEVANFAFDIEVLWRLRRARFRILEEPTIWADRQHGTKIDLSSSSVAMLKSILRLRLRESWLWLLPFVDRLAYKAVIPVVARHEILVLGGTLADLRRDPLLEDLFSALGAAGFSLSDTSNARSWIASGAASGWLSGLFSLLWYALQSHRAYDVIIEIPRPRPSLIPAISLKPSFIVATPKFPLNRRHRNLYQRSSFIDLGAVTEDEAVGTILVVQSGASLYKAVFYSGHESVLLQYSSEAGDLSQQVLHQ